MIRALRKLSLGVGLIVLTSAALLFSDWMQRRAPEDALPKVAVFKYSSRPLLDDAARGMVDGMAEEGIHDGKSVRFCYFNAENDLPTANAISKQITTGEYKLVATVSTLCLQTVANANKEGRAIHVFCAVTDPFGAGIGISRENPLDHPKHLVGIGSFQPVERTFELARQFYPGLKKVGVTWSPAEACAEACVLKARAKCKELGVELLEATVDNTTAVREAEQSLVARGAEALWIGGDNTVEIAIETVAVVARDGRIPLFCNTSGNVQHGVLFTLGAEYHEVGLIAGRLAGRILKGGQDPAATPVENIVPEALEINLTVLEGLKDPWRIPEEVRTRADRVIDRTGDHKKGQAVAPSKPAPGN